MQVCRDLRAHVQVRNNLRGTCVDKAPVPADLSLLMAQTECTKMHIDNIAVHHHLQTTFTTRGGRADCPVKRVRRCAEEGTLEEVCYRGGTTTEGLPLTRPLYFQVSEDTQMSSLEGKTGGPLKVRLKHQPTWET